MCTVYLVRIFSVGKWLCVQTEGSGQYGSCRACLSILSSAESGPLLFSAMPGSHHQLLSRACGCRQRLPQLARPVTPTREKVTDYITAAGLGVCSDGQGDPALVKGHLDKKKSLSYIFLSQVLVGMVHGISWVGRLLNGRVWQGSGYIPDTTERKKKPFRPLQIVRVF